MFRALYAVGAVDYRHELAELFEARHTSEGLERPAPAELAYVPPGGWDRSKDVPDDGPIFDRSLGKVVTEEVGP